MSISSVFSEKPEWEEIQTILQIFHQKGKEAVLAGGCVRDALLGKPPKDFDIAVSAPPEEVLRLFPKAKDRWAHYGVVFLPLEEKGKMVEITTFRRDHSYGDGRRPQFVEYTSSAEEDAKRRDFTVNALFYDVKNEQVLDFVDGLKDLRSGLLRTVGKPKERFEEDYLRPLRALRFSHQLKFSIDSETAKTIPSFSDKLQNLSKERIYSELVKMFSHGSLDQAVKILQDHDFFDVLFPFEKKPIGSPERFWKKSFSFYDEPSFVWAVFGLPYFYHAPEKLMELLKTLKAPQTVAKKSVQYIQGVRTLNSLFDEENAKGRIGTLLLKFKDFFVEKFQAIKILVSSFGRESVRGGLKTRLSEISFLDKLRVFELGSKQVFELSHNFNKFLFSQGMEEPLTQMQERKIRTELKEIEQLFQAFQIRSPGNDRLPPPLVTGEDLIKAGYSPGKGMGELLKKAYDFQLKENISEKESVLSWVLKNNL